MEIGRVRKIWESRRWVLLVVSVALLLSVTLSAQSVYMTIVSTGVEEKRWLVVLDPGHGGFDPGKVGVGEVLEKDINLAVALELRELLEQNDVTVIMTRETDVGLEQQGDENKKISDMRNRVELVNRAEADLAISIHQNSFTDPSSRGAQVFYHAESPSGKRLAEILQDQLKQTLQDGNHREVKSNDSYYMLKKTECPFAIIECGFLSNPEEAKLLQEEAYQKKLAWAIHLGVLQYLNSDLQK